MTTLLKPRSCNLADGDLPLLTFIFRNRAVTIDHLLPLTARGHAALHRRLVKLMTNGYVARRAFLGQKHVYLIGEKAIPLLVEQGIAPIELLDRRLRYHELKPLFLDHELCIADVHCALELACRESPLKLVAWRQGTELKDDVTFVEQGRSCRLPVWPDGFFTLEDSRRSPGANRASFLLEVDRSTSALTRLKRRFTAFWHYLKQEKHKDKYGVQKVRVVTIAKTAARAASLREAAAEVIPEVGRTYYLFASCEAFSLENPAPLLGDIFHTAHADTSHFLVPPLEGRGVQS